MGLYCYRQGAVQHSPDLPPDVGKLSQWWGSQYLSIWLQPSAQQVGTWFFGQPEKLIKHYQKTIGFLYHCMSRRINCRGCGSRHTGAGGSRCKILLARKSIKPDSTMATSDSSIPAPDSLDYIPYLERRIAEQEELLDQAEEQSKVRVLLAVQGGTSGETLITPPIDARSKTEKDTGRPVLYTEPINRPRVKIRNKKKKKKINK